MRTTGIVVACVLALAGGCKSKPDPKARVVAPQVIRDVPAVLRGTIGAEASLAKADPVLVAGYGLVVGLKGTGGGDLDERLMATMERELGFGGIGKAADGLMNTPLEGMTPQQVLRSRDVAVVVVFGAVIPGAPIGANFDVYVRAASHSPDISLEGGTLWTTELRIGPPTYTGGVKTRAIAKAHGPVFINPFSEPGAGAASARLPATPPAESRTAERPEGGGPDAAATAKKPDPRTTAAAHIARNEGRILGGGLVNNPLALELILDNESHSRARSMAAAINLRFPPEPGAEQVARGRSPRVINVTVPGAYRERSREFMEILLHTQIDQTLPQEYARKYIEALKAQPFLGDELSWCLQALPQKAALPFLRRLYDWPERAPKLAALRAGAGLGDSLAVPALKRLAKEESTSVRADAMRLLGQLSGATVDEALKEQLHSNLLPVRVAAYEALAARAERAVIRRWAAERGSSASIGSLGMRDNPSVLEFSGETIQGVSRKVIGRKFIVDVVPVGEPLIYVTQQGRPRIVLFGESLMITKPCMVSVWSDRLMLASDGPTDSVRLLYRSPTRLTAEGDPIPGTMFTTKVSEELPALMEFLAHEPTPEDPRPGLALTYSEVVGAIYAFQQARAIPGAFAVETDILKARLLRATNTDFPTERPESPDDSEKIKVYEPAPTPEPEPAKLDKGSLVQPLPPPRDKKK